MTRLHPLVHYAARADVARWWPSSSKRVGGVTSVAGGFDSHALSNPHNPATSGFGYLVAPLPGQNEHLTAEATVRQLVSRAGRSAARHRSGRLLRETRRTSKLVGPDGGVRKAVVHRWRCPKLAGYARCSTGCQLSARWCGSSHSGDLRRQGSARQAAPKHKDGSCGRHWHLVDWWWGMPATLQQDKRMRLTDHQCLRLCA